MVLERQDYIRGICHQLAFGDIWFRALVNPPLRDSFRHPFRDSSRAFKDELRKVESRNVISTISFSARMIHLVNDAFHRHTNIHVVLRYSFIVSLFSFHIFRPDVLIINALFAVTIFAFRHSQRLHLCYDVENMLSIILSNTALVSLKKRFDFVYPVYNFPRDFSHFFLQELFPFSRLYIIFMSFLRLLIY